MSGPTTLRRLAGLAPISAIAKDRTALVLIDIQMEYFAGGAVPLPESVRTAGLAERSVVGIGSGQRHR